MELLEEKSLIREFMGWSYYPSSTDWGALMLVLQKITNIHHVLKLNIDMVHYSIFVEIAYCDLAFTFEKHYLNNLETAVFLVIVEIIKWNNNLNMENFNV